MPRVTIHLPERLPFRTELPLLISQINHAGHLDNAQVLVLVSEARQRFLRWMGYRSETDIEGLGIILADNAVQYRSESFYGEVMVIEMAADDFSRRGCDFVWRMTEKLSGREVALGKSGVVFFDYSTRQVAEVPASFRSRWP
ncbi:acyl-CoA thioesterase [Ideonella oryzae]|uniref:Thioesterase family protein n=1 Tax=Ideonella oryzae TaxID=2937441 RepID=A0ABT1BGH8_9BURK|nr:thioesterase family protein [Ideonella oryzae]MCO5975345.1 thioesterase family protein [Ideonella oryzae]